jgi:hypothetical protein
LGRFRSRALFEIKKAYNFELRFGEDGERFLYDGLCRFIFYLLYNKVFN